MKIATLFYFLLLFGSLFSQNPEIESQRGNPDIIVTPAFLDLELETGQTATQYLSIHNSSNSELNFNVSSFINSPLKNSDTPKLSNKTPRNHPFASTNNQQNSASAQAKNKPKKNNPNKVLIFRDQLAWLLDVNVPILESLGASISIASSNKMATIDLSAYDLIVFESYQARAFYNNYQASINRFEIFLNSGGNIQFHFATEPGNRLENLEFPGGMQTLATANHSIYNFNANTNHPISINMPDTLSGSMSSHEAFKNIPAGSDTLTVNESGYPTSLEYTLGEGKILVTGMVLEIGHSTGWNFSNLLQNTFQYMLGLSGKLDYLSWNPVSGSIAPGSSQTIELEFDASDLYPDVYSATLLIRSKDLDEPLLSVPLTLTVTGQKPPLSLKATLDEITGKVELNWDFPLKEEFEWFKLYRNGVMLDTTGFNSYVDFLSDPGNYAYEVSAVYLEGESLPTGPVDVSWEGLPKILSTPTFIEEEIQSGDVLTKNIIIGNEGESQLHWNAAIQSTSKNPEEENYNYLTSLIPQDKIEEIIFNNQEFKNNQGIPSDGFDEILDAHQGESREIILVCVVDGGNFSTEIWDYLNVNWAYYGEQELLIDYSSLNGIEITDAALLNSSANVLIIDNNWNAEEAYAALSELECLAIAQYVNKGAGLFITGGTFNERQFSELEYQTQYLTPLVGIDPEAGFLWYHGQSKECNFLASSHPLFRNLDNPFGNTITGTSCQPENNNWFTALTTGDILAISEGNGTAIIGYENRIYHSSAPMLVTSNENIQFTYNVLSYCAVGYEPLDWLSVSPHFGSIPPGLSDTVKVKLGNPNLYPDFYTANISLTSNDPDEALINIPVSLTVEGQIPPTNLMANLDIKSGEVILSWEFQPRDDLLWFNVYQNDILIDTSSNLIYNHILPQAGTYTFKVTALYADGESAPASPVELIWEGKAEISVEPEFILEYLGPGQTSTKELKIFNAGEGELNWAIDFFEQAGTDNQGKPDAFGYYWLDSDQAGGPEYNWFDISEIGSNTGLTGDESFVELTLPFEFEFYGQTKNSILASSNGFLTFGAEAQKYHNDPIPLASEPNDLIAPFWDDLMSGDSGINYSYFDETNNRFIIQYTNWARYNAPGVATFQIHLHQNGSIYFYYQNLDCNVDQSTIGIENMDGTDGLLIKINKHYLHDFMAIKIIPKPSWITSDQLSGAISSGNNDLVNIHFDAEELEPGIYFADLIITNNDPENLLLTIPITLSVTTEILPTNLTTVLNQTTGDVDLSWDFQFDENFLWFKIYRDGALLDTNTSLYCSDILSAGGIFQYTISAFYSHGESIPSSFAEVFWEGMADISVEPGFLEESLGTGQISIQQLLISNSGEGKLEWALDIFALSESKQLHMPKNNYGDFKGGKGDTDPRTGNSPADGKGGPDAFGYSWIDSDEPGGPEYIWFDISEIGTNTLLTGDDEYLTLALPFDFKFYGLVQNEVLVSSNGYLTFGFDGIDYSNDPIPSGEHPNNLIAPFWNDLKAGEIGTNHSYYDEVNQRFIIQYSNWQKYNGAGEATFQVHLHQNGTIKFFYENMDCALNEATVGIENADGSDGLEIVFNADYLHNQLAIKMTSTPGWLTSDINSGIINSGESQMLNIYFDTTTLDTASYLAEIIIISDDPDEPLLIVPVSLMVGDIQIEEQIISLNLGWTGISSYLELEILNIDSLSSGIAGQLEIIQNLETFYQAGNNNNTLDVWNVKSGYFVKVNEEVSWVIEGNPLENTTVNIVEGWNLIPVLSDRSQSIETLFEANLSKVEIIKDALGLDVFWPDKNTFTLMELKPDKAYLLKANDSFKLIYE